MSDEAPRRRKFKAGRGTGDKGNFKLFIFISVNSR